MFKPKFNVKKDAQRVVIVGGGAGGLVLATRLAKQNKGVNKFNITLVDSRAAHVWKPILHEVASGHMNANEEALSYYSLGARDGYFFQHGSLKRINPLEKTIEVQKSHVHALSQRGAVTNKIIPYDILVLALGGVTQDFGIPGVKEHCYFLDGVEQAEKFHDDLIKEYFDSCIQDNTNNHASDSSVVEPELLQINIVGGGATGVELAMALSASIRHAQKNYRQLYLEKTIKLRLIEAGEDILPGQGKSLVDFAKQALAKAGVELNLGEKILEAKRTGLIGNNLGEIAGNFNVWVGGVRGPEFLANIEGLTVTSKHQVEVNEYLQSCGNPDIYAIGDCALCFDQGAVLAPRAQVAQQQAEYLAQVLTGEYENEPPRAFKFKDHGLFVSLHGRSAVGTLNTAFSKPIKLKGRFAGGIYSALYHKHYAEMAGPYLALLKSVKQCLGRRLAGVAKAF